MEFGKIPEPQLLTTDFTLPPDPKENKQTLKQGRGNTRFYIGCASMGRKGWVGRFYPQNAKEKDFLKYYSRQFSTIEFNGFYYNVHPQAQVEKWAAMVPDDFLFCPKFTQSITHVHRLKDIGHEVDEFLQAIAAFGDNLGPVFLMPHPFMGKTEMGAIFEFISNLPFDVKVFLELRHADWYSSERGYDPTMFQFLKDNKRGAVITDVAGRRNCAHMHLPVPECFIRFVGNGLHATDYTRIDQWVQRIGQWMKEGLETCYFFVHQHDELHAPELIRYFIEQMNIENNTRIPLPVRYDRSTLF